MAADDDLAAYVSHEEFRAGLAAGRVRVVVNPKLARRYVAQRLMLLVVLMPLIGVGIALALTGQRWLGAGLVFAGVALNRIVAWQAPKILLQMAQRDARVYDQVTDQAVMEVRRA
ncbi:hypothetical protein [Ramlibacter pallidus]|uniref:ABC transporter ATP-binding protein n=1 Tax=Ramlibacter pallidus TaxID=2780087 RepID=A0ABR9RY68_9BURK|nr:hypothetical protein [Ramlibacter pallidus]MBE7366164.1 hypothetical protein [Ramlibacter pallidus]